MVDKMADVSVGSDASGAGGAVSVAAPAGALVVRNGASECSSAGPGAKAQNLGNVTVKADSITLLDRGRISSLISGAARGGAIDVTSRGALFISDAGSNPLTLTGISAQGGIVDEAR